MKKKTSAYVNGFQALILVRSSCISVWGILKQISSEELRPITVYMYRVTKSKSRTVDTCSDHAARFGFIMGCGLHTIKWRLGNIGTCCHSKAFAISLR